MVVIISGNCSRPRDVFASGMRAIRMMRAIVVVVVCLVFAQGLIWLDEDVAAFLC